MNKLYIGKFNYDLTLIGGQSFSWSKINDQFYGVMQDKVVKVMPDGESIFWQTYPIQDDNEFVEKYFLRGMTYYDVMLKSVTKDQYVKNAYEKFPNIRLLNQDFEYSLLSFLISSNNSIKSIRSRITSFSKLFGEKIYVDNMPFYLFPKTDKIAGLSDADLSKTNLGYRGEYVVNAAKTLANKELSSVYRENTNEELVRTELLSIKGVGPKVADCVMVFGLGFDNLFPIDVWGKRILVDLYNHDPKSKYTDLSNWTKEYFGGYASYASQYLFEWYRLDVGRGART